MESTSHPAMFSMELLAIAITSHLKVRPGIYTLGKSHDVCHS